MKDEVWKDNYNGVYSVSNYGNIINLETGYRLKHKPSKTHGYHMVGSRISKSRSPHVHRIVYEVFVGDIPKDLQINHLDGNKSNNHLSNLEVCTASENVRHAHETGLISPLKGEAHSSSKVTEAEVLGMYQLFKLGYSNQFIADLYGLNFKHVSLLRNGSRWKYLFKKECMKVYPSLGITHALPKAVNIYNTCMLSTTPQEKLASILGIDPSEVSRIRTGKTWVRFRKHFGLPEETPDWKFRREQLTLDVTF